MIKINNNTKFSYKSEPLVIAEISSNHNGSKKKFLQLIEASFKNGADIVKIQTYEPKDITINKSYGNFRINEGLWKGKKLWDLYQKACTPFSWHQDAFKIAKKLNKQIFSSPFSIRAVDLLESLDCKIYKIASFEITDFKLISYIASKKKPIIISTGMANLNEIKKAVDLIRKYHSKIIIMHCVSNYPTDLEDINLERIDFLKKKFPNTYIGISDHTNNIYSSIAATTYGIVAIEKHVKLNEKTKTLDSTFSITPDRLKKLKEATKKIFLSKKRKRNQQISKKLRRSIYAIKNIKKNEKLSKHNIDTFRPYTGICASNYFKILTKKVKKNIKTGEPIFMTDIY